MQLLFRNKYSVLSYDRHNSVFTSKYYFYRSLLFFALLAFKRRLSRVLHTYIKRRKTISAVMTSFGGFFMRFDKLETHASKNIQIRSKILGLSDMNFTLNPKCSLLPLQLSFCKKRFSIFFFCFVTLRSFCWKLWFLKN